MCRLWTHFIDDNTEVEQRQSLLVNDIYCFDNSIIVMYVAIRIFVMSFS